MKNSNARKIYEKLINLKPYERLAIIDKKKQDEMACEECVCIACTIGVDEFHMYKIMGGGHINWTKRTLRVIDFIVFYLKDDDSFEMRVFDLRK